MTTLQNEPPKDVQSALTAARKAAAQSLRGFADTYLPHHFSLPPSTMHLELYALLEDISNRRGRRLAVAAPRGHAKSTLVSVAYVLWSICLRKEEFIVLLSDSSDQAVDHLAAVRRELEENHRLLEDYPEACESPELKPAPTRWRRNDLITRSGVRIAAFGAEQKIRGRKHQKARPTLIICDDLENEADVRSEDNRRNLREWFTRTLTKAGTSNTNIVVAGTILHPDSLLAGLTQREGAPGWITRIHRAVLSFSSRPDLWERWAAIYSGREDHLGQTGPDGAEAHYQEKREEMLEGAEVLWPEREDYLELMKIRLHDGQASFDSEKQNQPINPEECYFTDADFHYWDDEYPTAMDLFEAMDGHGIFYGACDPSMGHEGKRHDDAAVVTLLKDERTGVMYVVDAVIRRRRLLELIQDIIDLHRDRHFDAFGMETNQFQQFLSEELDRQSRACKAYVPVIDITNTRDKAGRIQRLQPMISTGRIRFSRRHTTLLQQLKQFPLAAHDDGPDALEMAVRTIDHSVPALVTGEMLDRYKATGRWYED